MSEIQNEPNVLAEVPSLPDILAEEPAESPDVTLIAQEVLAGHWGRGHDRERRLRNAGHNVAEVNLKINELLHR